MPRSGGAAAVALLAIAASTAPACRPTANNASPVTASPAVRNVVLITIDTLRADRVGAYGYGAARTPVLDEIARRGVRFSNAFAPTPITLPSHASLLTGQYPPGHGARHNGIGASQTVGTLAAELTAQGFATGAFVSAFPLDRRFGLARGFERYDDELGRGGDGRLRNEREGNETTRRSIAWMNEVRSRPFFLWLHLFEPHAPYAAPDGVPGNRGSVADRYDAEIALADAAVGQLLKALGDELSRTALVVTADHGEAFGEHGEVGHSIFVYDTTLRIPLLLQAPGLPAGTLVDDAVSLVDVAPTLLALLGKGRLDADGVSLLQAVGGAALSERVLYAESFAPLFDFGWSPLRSVRERQWKYIAAPRAELYAIEQDAAETHNREPTDPQPAARLRARVEAFGSSERPSAAAPDAESARRLQSLGYLSGDASRSSGGRADPKDRIAMASRLASVMAGEVKGDALVATLEAVLREDPDNPQAHLRLGFAHADAGRCPRAVPHFEEALGARLPSADAGLGLAHCMSAAGRTAAAEAALRQADALEPGNPAVLANLGLIAFARRDGDAAIDLLQQALRIDPDLHEGRFTLARALALAGRRTDALEQASTLLARLPPTAPQRAEVERLVRAIGPS